MRRLPCLIALAAAAVIAAGFRPPPGDRTDCVYNAEIAACTRLIESGKLKGSALGRIYWQRAAAFERDEEYDRAVADYQVAIRLDPKDDDAPHRLALALNKEAHITQLILSNLARVYKAQGKHALAEASFRRMLAIYEAGIRKDPDDITPVYGLADLYKEWGKYD